MACSSPGKSPISSKERSRDFLTRSSAGSVGNCASKRAADVPEQFALYGAFLKTWCNPIRTVRRCRGSAREWLWRQFLPVSLVSPMISVVEGTRAIASIIAITFTRIRALTPTRFLERDSRSSGSSGVACQQDFTTCACLRYGSGPAGSMASYGFDGIIERPWRMASIAVSVASTRLSMMAGMHDGCQCLDAPQGSNPADPRQSHVGNDQINSILTGALNRSFGPSR